MDGKRFKGMDAERQIGRWLMRQARLSFKYWHSSPVCRDHMNKPFFDRTQCQYILSQYRGQEEKRRA